MKPSEICDTILTSARKKNLLLTTTDQNVENKQVSSKFDVKKTLAVRESQADTPNACQPKLKITLFSYNKPRGEWSGDLEFINLLNQF